MFFWLSTLVAVPGFAVPRIDEPLDISVHLRALGHGGRAALLAGELEATVTLHNRSDEAQRYRGEVADEEGRLVLSGEWELYLDEVRLGRVVASKRLTGADPAAAGEPRILAADERHKWKVRLPVAAWIDHPGNYLLRARLGAIEESGSLLRVAETRSTPEWISLAYTPAKRSYRLGESIDVRFVMRNDGDDDFPYAHGGDYRGATRHLRFAFTAESSGGESAVDPDPSQSCFGGFGNGNARLKPDSSYETDLPLLAYLAFPSPGIYTVTAYQGLGFGAPVAGLEEAGMGPYAYGGTFEVEITAPEPRQAAELVHELLTIDDEYERRRRFSFLSHPVYLEPLKALADDETVPIGDGIRAIGEIFTTEATRTLLALAGHRRAEVRIAALQALLDRRPVPEDPGIRSKGLRFYRSPTRRRQVAALWEEVGLAELWSVFEGALASGRGREASLGGGGILSRGDPADVELLARAADRLAPRLPFTKEQRDAVSHLAGTAFSFAWTFGAAPVAVDEDSSPARLVVWANMLRPAEARLDAGEEALVLRMVQTREALLRHTAIRWVPDGFSRAAEIPWRELLGDSDHSVWWYAVHAAKRLPARDLDLLVRELAQSTEDAMKRRDLEELLAIWEKEPPPG